MVTGSWELDLNLKLVDQHLSGTCTLTQDSRGMFPKLAP